MGPCVHPAGDILAIPQALPLIDFKVGLQVQKLGPAAEDAAERSLIPELKAFG